MMKLPSALFVTGTDTEVGKSLVSAALLRALQKRGVCANGYKPVAAGAEYLDGHWSNEDGRLLLASSAASLRYEQVNPVMLMMPIAPHIAAKREGQVIDSTLLSQGLHVLKEQSDCVVVEGAGGWFVPLDEHELLCDWAMREQLPVVLVVGMRLGCLNHALLSAGAIQSSGLPLLGWVANCLSKPDSVMEDNIDYLKKALNVPLLGVVAHQTPPNIDATAATLDVDPLYLDSMA
jgi:dethiobiotin synthetase